jgi:hypothetical protein
MPSPLHHFIAQSPRRAIVLGKAALVLGGTLVIAAWFGRTGLITANAARTKDGLPPWDRLAQAYPALPTWLVPEGPWGYTVCAALVLAGMVLVVQAERTPRRRP